MSRPGDLPFMNNPVPEAGYDSGVNGDRPSGVRDPDTPAEDWTVDDGAASGSPWNLGDRFRDGNTVWIRYALAVLGVALLSLAMLPIRDILGVLNVTLLFLVLAFGIGLALGSGPAVAGAVLAFLALDFIFIPPYYTFTVANPDHLLGLFVYLGIALTSSLLVARLRATSKEAVQQSARTTLLYDLNRSLVADVTLAQVLQSIVKSVVEVYGAAGSRIVVAEDDDRLDVRARWPAAMPATLDRQAQVMARWAIEHQSPAGISDDGRRIRLPHGTSRTTGRVLQRRKQDMLYVPITAGGKAIGVLEIAGKPGGGRFTPDDERILTSFADQAALAMQRALLTEEATRADALEQASELKSALLAAVSHDLRTPLAGIKASASTLLDTSVEWSPETRAELLTAIDEETDRLTLMVSNLLDLSRIEGGALKPDRDWQDMEELIHDVVRRVSRQAGKRPIELEIPGDLPVVYMDYVEIAQVLVNLVSNAINYSQDGSTITISAWVDEDEIVVSVRDRGRGIPAASLPHVFTTFYRVHEHGPVAGSGIGLSICKGLVEAHGGRIWAESRVGEGTTMTFALPLRAPAGAPGGPKPPEVVS